MAASKSSPVTRHHDLDSEGYLLLTCGNSCSNLSPLLLLVLYLCSVSSGELK